MNIKRLTNGYLDSFRGLPKKAWLLSLVVLVNHAGSMVVFFLPLYLTGKMGFSVMSAGRLISVWGMGSLIGSYAGGWLSDRWGSKAVQRMSLVTAGAGYIAMGYMDSYAGLAVVVFMLAIVANAFRPAMVTAFTELCAGETQARGFALMRLAVNLGFSVGPALGGILAMHNYKYLFWANGLTSFAAAAVLEAVIEDPEPHERKIEAAGHSASPYRDLTALRFLGLLLVIGVVFFQLFGTWPLYMKQVRGFSESRIGLLLTVNALMIVLFEMQLIRRIEKKDPLSMIAIGTLFVAAGFGLLPLMRGWILIGASTVLWTIGEMLIFPLSATFIAGRAGRSGAENSGSYMGLFTLSFSLSSVISPAAGTWAYNRFGPTALWFACGIVGLLVWVGFRGLRKSSASSPAHAVPATVPAPVLPETG
jgi:MFS family permease